jgi:hypothetical protein
MNLQTILYGQFTPPLASNVRRHSILHDPNRPYVGFVAKPPKPSELDDFCDRMFDLVKAHPGICLKELNQTLNKAPSFLYKIRNRLIEQGRVYGVRGKPPRRGGPVTTLLYVRDYAR